jgi:hypothetical protein
VPRPPKPNAADAGDRPFIPAGVDATSWLGFEQRIQERRFRSLIDTIIAAIAAGDAVNARVALEEARELSPSSPQVASLASAVGALPLAVSTGAASSFAWSRAAGAVTLLLFGVGLLTGLDFVRSDGRQPVTSDMLIAAPMPGVHVNAVDPDTELVLAERAAPLPVMAAGAHEPEPRIVGTAGTMVTTEPAVAAVAVRPLTPVPRTSTIPAGAEDPGGVPVGETPDDFVAPRVHEVATYVGPAASASASGVRGREAVGTPAPGISGAETASAGAATVSAPVVSRVDESRVAQVLNQYARAYGRLDAGAARAVWPSVDERALARAFAGLESQDVEFDACSIDVRGATANASCRGRASYVGKIGSREPRTETRQWQFELRRDGDAWMIESAEAHRGTAF